MLMIFFLPLLACNLSADFDTILTATDASETRVGGSECLLGSPEQIQELCRNSVFKGDYSNLDEVVGFALAAVGSLPATRPLAAVPFLFPL